MKQSKKIVKKRLQPVLMILTLVSLVALVGIQVSWIIRTARMQEAQFNHSVTMAMNRAVDNLSRDRMLCDQISNCLMDVDPGACSMAMQHLAEWDNIKAVIEDDLRYYGLDLDFEFDIVRGDQMDYNGGSQQKEIYLSEGLEEMLERSGYKLKISFPGRRDFIVAQMGSVFVVSIILLVIVTLSSIIIYRLYRRERELSANIVDFVNSMTHAFKTPLTNISLANSMIAKNTVVGNDRKMTSYTGIIKSEHRKLKERVDRLLTTTFSETDPPSLHEPIDVVPVAADIASTFDVQVSDRSGTIELEQEGGAIYVAGNPDLFYIALSNIVDNSVRYCETPPEIKISLRKENNRVIITVKDNGRGVPGEYLESIFDRHFRVPADEKHNAEGFGLGLYQVKNIITRMNGRVKATQPEGGGLAITIDLPALGEK
ncbi:MAG: sensor histidine kinase [Bacteroidales bacterium]